MPTEAIVDHATILAVELVQMVLKQTLQLTVQQLELQLATVLKVLRQRMQTYLHTTVYSQLLNTNRGN